MVRVNNKQRIFFLLLLIAVQFTSCKVFISEEENRGIENVLNSYGGVCKYSKGIKASIENVKMYFFEIEISRSEVVERFYQNAEIPASNAALLFYKALEDEKNNYTQIRIILTFNDKSKSEHEYSVETLESAKQGIVIFNKVVKILKEQRYTELSTLLDNNNRIKYDKNQLLDNIKLVDKEYGNIKKAQILGFQMNKLENGEDVLHLVGRLEREIQSTNFSLDLSPSDLKKVLLINYKF